MVVCGCGCGCVYVRTVVRLLSSMGVAPDLEITNCGGSAGKSDSTFGLMCVCDFPGLLLVAYLGGVQRMILFLAGMLWGCRYWFAQLSQ